MEIKSIRAGVLAKMYLAGAKYLEKRSSEINELNVFPVPDGDTGINMTMTVMSAAREVIALGSDPDMKALCKAISGGSLRGARGNSGVILSQLLRGFTKVVKTSDEITVPILAESFDRAAETAYKAVMKPKEGTILTVARRAADKGIESAKETDDIIVFLSDVFNEAEATLKETPDMLPVLKEAGVVDSGGAGLLEILRGALDFLNGRDIDLTIKDTDDGKEKASEDAAQYRYHMSFKLYPEGQTLEKRKEEYNKFLAAVGVNFSNNNNDSFIETSIDTNVPGEVLTKAVSLGIIDEISIVNTKPVVKSENKENLETEDASDTSQKEISAEKAKAGFVAVCAGDGMAEIFKEIGADQVISGGQTMNPSAGDILSAVDKVNADTVFVLPNNKNIILAANQAAEMSKDKKILVVPSKTIPQGITALVNFIQDETPEENLSNMISEMSSVKTGEVTYAVRDTVIDGKQIKKDDYIGIGDEGLISNSSDMNTLFHDMMKQMISEDSSLVSIYYGQDVNPADAEDIANLIRSDFPEIEVETESGGQPVYYYIISVE